MNDATLWSIEPARLEAMAAAGELTARASDRGRRGDTHDYPLERGVALIDLSGVMTKHGGWHGPSSLDAAATIAAAAADRDVTCLLLRIDSPGGELPGIDELAAAIAAADQTKPVYAFAEDLCASAAYWVASQARRIFANRTAVVGGIGVYRVLVDLSAAAAQEGVKVHVVKSGPRKGAGVPGTAIDDETLNEAQKLVDAAHDQFVRAVAGGRQLSLTATRELADGRVFTANEAKAAGLIDEVRDLDSVVAQLAKKHETATKSTINKPTGARGMSEPQEIVAVEAVAPRAASLAELKAELLGAPAEFLINQLEAAATLPQASKAWIAQLSASREAALEQARAAEAKLVESEKTRGARPGVEPLPTSAAEGGDAGDALAVWERLVAAEMDAKRGDGRPVKLGSLTPRMRAQLAAAKKNPEAHAAYLTAYNSARRKEFGVRRAMRLSEAAAVAAENA